MYGNGAIKFDYYDYVMSNLDYVIRSTRNHSASAGDRIINIGTLTYATHNDKGTPLKDIGIDGAEMLVHEVAHMLSGRVKHIKCQPSDKYRNCGGQFHSILVGDAEFDDPAVDAYSISVAYLTDVILFGEGRYYNRERAVYLIEFILNNRFVKRSPEHPNGITEQQIEAALKLVNAN